MPTEQIDHMKELSDRLTQGIKELFSSDRYRDYLTTASKFHQYSSRNAMLIYLQKPNATYVAGFNAWNNMQRSINKGETGIRILVPIPHKKTVNVNHDEHGRPLPFPQQKEITTTSFRPAYVFDVSQTNGRELPKLVTQMMGQVHDYSTLMESLQQISPYPIVFGALDDGVNGRCNYSTQQVVLRENLSQEQAIKTAIHEIAHAKLHGGGNVDRATSELQAESVAYMVCQHFNIDSSQFSFGYIVGWGKDKAVSELQSSLEVIQKTARDIIFNTEKALSMKRTVEKTVEPKIEQEKVKEKKPRVTERLNSAKKKCVQQPASNIQQNPKKQRSTER